MKNYYIIYNPGPYQLMDIIGTEDGLSIWSLITWLTGHNSTLITNGNYKKYLDFDNNKRRKSMMEVFGVDSYAAHYIGNQIARYDPDAFVVHSDDIRRTIREIIDNMGCKPKCVFITSMSANFPTTVAKTVVLNYGKIPVVIGGIHVSVCDTDVDIYIRNNCPHPEIVAQVVGPGDSQVIKEIIDDIKREMLKKQYDNGSVTLEDGVWEPCKNVVFLPRMETALQEKFGVIGKFIAQKTKITPVAPFLGCPYSCNFCSISTLPKNRRALVVRSTKDFLNELDYHQNTNNSFSRYFLFLPDNILLGGQKFENTLDCMIARKMKINFIAQVSIDVASNDVLLKKLRDAGATHFLIGLESLDLRNLEYISKPIVKSIKKSRLSVAEYYELQIKKIQDHGISIHGAFILGLPFDYYESESENSGIDIARFCIKNHIGLQSCPLTDLPGSKNFNDSHNRQEWLYGQKGTFDYLLSLCATDLKEPNRKAPDALDGSPLKVACMSFEAMDRSGAISCAIRNAFFMMRKSFLFPTMRGRTSLIERIIDSLYSFTSQLIVSLYREHDMHIVFSNHHYKGSIERLYERETEHIRQHLCKQVSRFRFTKKNVKLTKAKKKFLPSVSNFISRVCIILILNANIYQ